MGVNGQPVVTVSGPTTKEGLLEKIEEGKIAFAAQVCLKFKCLVQ